MEYRGTLAHLELVDDILQKQLIWGSLATQKGAQGFLSKYSKHSNPFGGHRQHCERQPRSRTSPPSGAAEKNGITFVTIHFLLRIQWLSQNLQLENSCICTRRVPTRLSLLEHWNTTDRTDVVDTALNSARKTAGNSPNDLLRGLCQWAVLLTDQNPAKRPYQCPPAPALNRLRTHEEIIVTRRAPLTPGRICG
jgi:hypothetical protein